MAIAGSKQPHCADPAGQSGSCEKTAGYNREGGEAGRNKTGGTVGGGVERDCKWKEKKTHRQMGMDEAEENPARHTHERRAGRKQHLTQRRSGMADAVLIGEPLQNIHHRRKASRERAKKEWRLPHGCSEPLPGGKRRSESQMVFRRFWRRQRWRTNRSTRQ